MEFYNVLSQAVLREYMLHPDDIPEGTPPEHIEKTYAMFSGDNDVRNTYFYWWFTKPENLKTYIESDFTSPITFITSLFNIKGFNNLYRILENLDIVFEGETRGFEYIERSKGIDFTGWYELKVLREIFNIEITNPQYKAMKRDGEIEYYIDRLNFKYLTVKDIRESKWGLLLKGGISHKELMELYPIKSYVEGLTESEFIEFFNEHLQFSDIDSMDVNEEISFSLKMFLKEKNHVQ